MKRLAALILALLALAFPALATPVLSGSSATTTGSIAAGSHTLTVASGTSFGNGQAIVVYGAGSPHGLTVPAAPPITPSVTGTGSYTYRAMAWTSQYGYTALSPATTITNGPASLTAMATAPVYGELAEQPGAYAYGLYRLLSGTVFTLVDVVVHSDWTPDSFDGSAWSRTAVTATPNGGGWDIAETATTALHYLREQPNANRMDLRVRGVPSMLRLTVQKISGTHNTIYIRNNFGAQVRTTLYFNTVTGAVSVPIANSNGALPVYLHTSLADLGGGKWQLDVLIDPYDSYAWDIGMLPPTLGDITPYLGDPSNVIRLYSAQLIPIARDSGKSANAPDGMPSNASVGQTFPNYLMTTVTAGGGTTTLTLADAAQTTVSGRKVTHDDHDALQALLDGSVGRVPIHAGNYVMHQGLLLRRQLILDGDGQDTTQLLGVGMFPAVWAQSASNSADGGSANDSRLEDLTIGVFGLGHSLPVAHGLLANVRVDADHVSFGPHGADGLHIDANLPNNADGAIYTACQFNSNRDNGVFVTGGDANTIVFDSSTASGNGRSGFLESGFLGNKYRVNHTQANGVDARGAASGPYYVDHYEAVNSSSFEQCYSEGNQPAIRVPAPASWTGVQAPAGGFTGDSARVPAPLAIVTASLDFGTIPAASEVERSVTYSGVTSSSWLRVRLPSTVPSGVVVTAWVSGANVVRVRARNNGSAAVAFSGSFGLLAEGT